MKSATAKTPQAAGALKAAATTTLKPGGLAGVSADRTQLAKGSMARERKTSKTGLEAINLQGVETIFEEHKATTEQSRKMSSLSAGVQRMSSIFEEAAKTRAEQRRMMDDLHENTMKKVQITWADMQRIMGELTASMGDFVQNFRKQLEQTKEDLCRDQHQRVAGINAQIEILERRSVALQQGLDEERANRIRETEDVLGPIRKRVEKLTAALDKEQQIRLNREAELRKHLDEAVEELNNNCKIEEQNRQDRAAEIQADCEKEQGRLLKRQNQIERQTKIKLKELDQSLVDEKKHRLEGQDLVVAKVTDFIRRFQANVREEGEMG